MLKFKFFRDINLSPNKTFPGRISVDISSRIPQKLIVTEEQELDPIEKGCPSKIIHIYEHPWYSEKKKKTKNVKRLLKLYIFEHLWASQFYSMEVRKTCSPVSFKFHRPISSVDIIGECVMAFENADRHSNLIPCHLNDITCIVHYVCVERILRRNYFESIIISILYLIIIMNNKYEIWYLKPCVFNLRSVRSIYDDRLSRHRFIPDILHSKNPSLALSSKNYISYCTIPELYLRLITIALQEVLLISLN